MRWWVEAENTLRYFGGQIEDPRKLLLNILSQLYSSFKSFILKETENTIVKVDRGDGRGFRLFLTK